MEIAITSSLSDRVYGLSASVAVKAPCVTVTTTPNLLNGLAAIGGYTPQPNDRILVAANIDPATNGIYNASAGAWARSGDFDGPYDAVQGTLIVVYFPNVHTTIIYQLITPNPIIGTSPLVFTPFVNPNDQVYPQTADEFTAGVIPTYPLYPPGNLLRYGADPTGVFDSTGAIQQAAAVQAVANREIVADGIFLYTPTARVDIKGVWKGSGKLRSAIRINTGSFSGDYFRVTGHGILRDITVQATVGTGVGTGVYLSADPDSGFTGDIRLSGVNIFGFNIGLSIGNVFKALIDRVDVSGCNYGEYCVPNPAGGGYCNLVAHLNCDIFGNGVNAYFNPSVNCNEIAYYNCAIENATGTTLVSGLTMNAYFVNVNRLSFHSTYMEGSAVTYALFTSASILEITGMDNQSTGDILIANTNCKATLTAVTSTGHLLAGGATTPVALTLRGSSFPASGNTWNAATTNIDNSSINCPGTTYLNEVGGLMQIGFGIPVTAGGANLAQFGAGGQGLLVGSGAPTTSANKGSMYMRTDGSSPTTRLYVNTDGGTAWTSITTAT